MEGEFRNKVAESGIITIDPADFIPSDIIAVFDLKDYLFMGLILKEKEFREALKQVDLSAFQNKTVAVTCSADAIIPVWAYMLIASLLQPVAKEVFVADAEKAKQLSAIEKIKKISANEYQDARIVLKGCGDVAVSDAVYFELTAKLRPVAKSIMYGEPCSTVPVYKQPLVKRTV